MKFFGWLHQLVYDEIVCMDETTFDLRQKTSKCLLPAGINLENVEE